MVSEEREGIATDGDASAVSANFTKQLRAELAASPYCLFPC